MEYPIRNYNFKWNGNVQVELQFQMEWQCSGGITISNGMAMFRWNYNFKWNGNIQVEFQVEWQCSGGITISSGMAMFRWNYNFKWNGNVQVEVEWQVKSSTTTESLNWRSPPRTISTRPLTTSQYVLCLQEALHQGSVQSIEEIPDGMARRRARPT
jgi:hypothetical protein